MQSVLLTETWLTDVVPDSDVNIPGFSLVQADRYAQKGGKAEGGGLTLFVNNKWYHSGNTAVKMKSCCRDEEVLAVSLRPYYVPREFPHIVTITVYIPPGADASGHCREDSVPTLTS